MPKLQDATTIRRARLAASESPNATSNHFNVMGGSVERSRLYLPEAANNLREALYAGERQPTGAEKEQVYYQIRDMVGTKYTRKAHSNYCTKKQRERAMGPRRIIAAKMAECPNPTMIDLLTWANETGISSWEAFRIIETELSEAVKELAKGESLLDSFTF